MRISLDSLMVLDAIARRGSFAAAAEELHRVPSALTYAVRKLEEDLDVALFDRGGHRARLTEAGEELLREGRHLLRAAGELECRVKRVATGWETELRIAVNALVPLARLYPLVREFYGTDCGTRLKLTREVLAGAWDALVSERADLVVGVDTEPPAGGGYATRPLGTVGFAFVVAPSHPLAAAPEPIPPELIQIHRSVSAADSSRHLPARTSGILSGQDVFTVPDLDAKREAHMAGLGVGFMPRHLVAGDLAAGLLVEKQVAESKPEVATRLAWRSAHQGKALQWWVKRLSEPGAGEALFAA